MHRRGAAGIGSNTLSPKKHWEVLEEWGLWSARAAHLPHIKRHSPSTSAVHCIDCKLHSLETWKDRLFALPLSQALSFMLPLSFPLCISHSRSHSCSLAHSHFPGCIFSSLAIQRM